MCLICDVLQEVVDLENHSTLFNRGLIGIVCSGVSGIMVATAC